MDSGRVETLRRIQVAASLLLAAGLGHMVLSRFEWGILAACALVTVGAFTIAAVDSRHRRLRRLRRL
ncbi:MAG TPA: hypothetical protein VMZ31_03640 [Phycisphaerae bacterium]|nr:hypothetical protein [Phycisphaerae bacterium]